MEKMKALPVFRDGEKILFSRSPQISHTNIMQIHPVQKISELKKGDIVLKFDPKVGSDSFMFVVILMDYDKENESWNWNFINSDCEVSEMGGIDKPDAFFIQPIDSKDDFEGDTISSIK